MRHRHQEAPTPWIQEPDPTVAEPTATGKAILRMWIEEQLRLVAARRRHRQVWRRR